MNNKLTTPKAILIGSFMIAGTILYTSGFNFSIITEAKADYHWADSSHDHYYADESHDHSDYAYYSHDHSHDHDEFSDILSKSRIKKIIENCDVDGEEIDC